MGLPAPTRPSQPLPVHSPHNSQCDPLKDENRVMPFMIKTASGVSSPPEWNSKFSEWPAYPYTVLFPITCLVSFPITLLLTYSTFQPTRLSDVSRKRQTYSHPGACAFATPLLYLHPTSLACSLISLGLCSQAPFLEKLLMTTIYKTAAPGRVLSMPGFIFLHSSYYLSSATMIDVLVAYLFLN